MGNYRVIVQRKKIKNMYLRVRAADELLVTCPLRTSNERIDAFLKSKAEWIDRAAETRQFSCAAILDDSQALVLGEYYPIRVREGSFDAIDVTEDGTVTLTLVDPADEEKKELLMGKWCAHLVRRRAEELVLEILGEAGGVPHRVRVRDMKTRWGSYSKKTNTLCVNVRLGAYSQGALRSVVCHELAHTVHMDHQQEFYRLLYALMPDYARYHGELKTPKPEKRWYMA